MNCPYCFGEVHQDAKKCKHCGEWLIDKPKNKLFSGIIEKANSIKKEYEKKKELKKIEERKHLYYPTNNEPLEINGIIFFGDYFIYKGEKIDYKKISSIKFHSSSSNINNYIEYSIKMSLIIDLADRNILIEENDPNKKIIELNYNYSPQSLRSKTKRKKFEQLNLFSRFIRNLTANQRLNKYLDTIIKKGYYPYKSYKIFKNGDIKKDGEFKANLFEAIKSDLLIYKNKTSHSLKGKSYDPYELEIVKSNKPKTSLIGIKLYRNFTMHIDTDQEIFDHLYNL